MGAALAVWSRLVSWRIETVFRERHGRTDLVLVDYFDLIGGTSTGSIIAAALAIRITVDEIRNLYLAAGGEAFGQKLPFYQRLRATYDKVPLERLLRAELGEMTLGSAELRTGLCIVAKRADTNSRWPMHNHPRSRYFEAN
jgi:patatin-like phospholipase/acyl hydrolase